MKWGMEIAELEAVLEKIWDLHDKLSDAIHSISRTHFLNSLKNSSSDPRRKPFSAGADDGNCNAFVYVKGWEKDSAISEARSLNAIRTALENLEDQLEFFHTVQIQQRAERDAAFAQLEQSRIILALRLAEHHGKRYKVIEEALDFIGDVQEPSCCISHENTKSNLFKRLVCYGVDCAKRTVRFEGMGGAFGNAALFALSMVAVLRLHQVSYRNSYMVEVNPNGSRTLKKPNDWSCLDVFSARG